jgi:hypothetical protein
MKAGIEGSEMRSSTLIFDLNLCLLSPESDWYHLPPKTPYKIGQR